ncbi:MAG: helix-turn-helix domain-containing protein [Bradyrhizobium sp.]|nr:helix-turn-helix domain-containing protein [Bradyrhizobium sp.]
MRDKVRENTTLIGARIREARRLKNKSQSDLAARLGVSFQQVQKYENGKNRVSVASLIAIAEEIDVDLGFFLPPGSVPVDNTQIEIARNEAASSLAAIDSAIAVLSDHRRRLSDAAARLGTSEI